MAPRCLSGLTGIRGWTPPARVAPSSSSSSPERTFRKVKAKDTELVWMYEIGVRHFPPTANLLDTPASRLFSPHTHTKFMKLMRKYFHHLSNLNRVCIVTIFAMWATPASLGRIVTPLMSIGCFPVLVVSILLMSSELIDLLLHQHEFWFFTTTNALNWIIASILFNDTRFLGCIVCFVITQLAILMDANFRTAISATKSCVLWVPAICMILFVCATRIVDIDATRFHKVIPKNKIDFTLANSFLNNNMTLMIFIVRKTYARRHLLRKQFLRDKIIPCSVLRCDLVLQRMVASDLEGRTRFERFQSVGREHRSGGEENEGAHAPTAAAATTPAVATAITPPSSVDGNSIRAASLTLSTGRTTTTTTITLATCDVHGATTGIQMPVFARVPSTRSSRRRSTAPFTEAAAAMASVLPGQGSLHSSMESTGTAASKATDPPLAPSSRRYDSSPRLLSAAALAGVTPEAAVETPPPPPQPQPQQDQEQDGPRQTLRIVTPMLSFLDLRDRVLPMWSPSKSVPAWLAVLHYTCGLCGLVLGALTMYFPVAKTIHGNSSSTLVYMAVPGVSLACSLLFFLPFFASCQVDILRALTRNFEFMFTSIQFTLGCVCLGDMMQWDYRCLALLSWLLWFHLILLWDALVPVIKERFHFKKVYGTFVLVSIMGGLAWIVYSLFFSSYDALQDRTILQIQWGDVELKIRTSTFLVGRLNTILTWSIRLVWKAVRSEEDELIFIRGYLEYYTPMELFPLVGLVGGNDSVAPLVAKRAHQDVHIQNGLSVTGESVGGAARLTTSGMGGAIADLVSLAEDENGE